MAAGPSAVYAGRSERRAAVSASARLLRLARDLNAERPPDHRERIAQAVAVTQEYFRLGPASDLPPAGADALLDGIHRLATACDESPDGFARACADLDKLERLEQGT